MGTDGRASSADRRYLLELFWLGHSQLRVCAQAVAVSPHSAATVKVSMQLNPVDVVGFCF